VLALVLVAAAGAANSANPLSRLLKAADEDES
jgi:hypothetical protein